EVPRTRCLGAEHGCEALPRLPLQRRVVENTCGVMDMAQVPAARCDLVADANHVFHARDVTCEYGDVGTGRAHRFDLCTRLLRRAASSGQHDLPHPLIDQSLRDGEADTAETARDPDCTVVRRRTPGFEDDLADVPGLGHVAECRGRV